MEKKKGLKFYWEFMDVPVIIFIVYSLAMLVFPLSGYIGTTLTSVIGFAITVLTFGWISFRISRRENKKEEIHYGKAGMWAGIVIGLASAALGILAFYLLPETFAASIQQAVNAGAPAATVKLFIQIGLFAGLVINPAIYAALGALFVWLGKLIFEKKQKAEWVKGKSTKKK